MPCRCAFPIDDLRLRSHFYLTGSVLAFVSDREHPRHPAVFLRGDHNRNLWTPVGRIEDIEWSRDGRRLLVLVAGEDTDGDRRGSRG